MLHISQNLHTVALLVIDLSYALMFKEITENKSTSTDRRGAPDQFFSRTIFLTIVRIIDIEVEEQKVLCPSKFVGSVHCEREEET